MINQSKVRQVILDIETTGMNKHGCVYLNHKIIEIGIIELINRRYTGKYLHYYFNPNRKIESEAYKIHGISNNFLLNKPFFKDVFINIIDFIRGSEIIVHNSSFDISFLNYELSLLNYKIKNINELSNIIDTLLIARKLFPGKKNSLDALCHRYKIFNMNRNLHSALLDAKILMKIYLYMTSKQNEIQFSFNNNFLSTESFNTKNIQKNLKILYASTSECSKHDKYMCMIEKK